MKIFEYGRTSPLISDPGHVLEALPLSTHATDNLHVRRGLTDIERAMAEQGELPVARSLWGLGVARLTMAVIAGVLGVVGLAVALSSSRGAVAGAVVCALCVLLIAVVLVSARRRQFAIEQLTRAWEEGWINYAPARVGGVWISGQSAHNVGDKRTNEIRYRFRAVVEVPAGEYGPGFRFESEEFTAPADREGVPVELSMAPSELDVMEPEYFNGWTIARWVVGAEVKSATITTDLNSKQIVAGLNAAGIV